MAKASDSDSTILSSKDVGIDTNADKSNDKYKENGTMIQHPTLSSNSNSSYSSFPPISSYDAEACPKLITTTMARITMYEEEEGLPTSGVKAHSNKNQVEKRREPSVQFHNQHRVVSKIEN